MISPSQLQVHATTDAPRDVQAGLVNERCRRWRAGPSPIPPNHLSIRVRPLDRLRHGPARQDPYEMRAIFGTTVDVTAHAFRPDRHAFERLGPEALLERLLERGHAEHAIAARAGHRHADLGA